MNGSPRRGDRSAGPGRFDGGAAPSWTKFKLRGTVWWKSEASMLRTAKGAMLAVAMLLPVPSQAGTPAVEADRCSRYLTAMAHGDVEGAINVELERFKPGERPERYIRGEREDYININRHLAEMGEIKTIESLPDVVVPQTGDILRRQKWSYGNGEVDWTGCVLWPGGNDYWNLTLTSAKSDKVLIDTQIDIVTSDNSNDAYRRWLSK